MLTALTGVSASQPRATATAGGAPAQPAQLHVPWSVEQFHWDPASLTATRAAEDSSRVGGETAEGDAGSAEAAPAPQQQQQQQHNGPAARADGPGADRLSGSNSNSNAGAEGSSGAAAAGEAAEGAAPAASGGAGGGGAAKASNKPPPACQVCGTDVSGLKDYYQRYKICGTHCVMPCVVMHGEHLRFCQQCGRFQPLADFDDNKRTCRRKLERHNERRRALSASARKAAAEGGGDSPPPAKPAKPARGKDKPAGSHASSTTAAAAGAAARKHKRKAAAGAAAAGATKARQVAGKAGAAAAGAAFQQQQQRLLEPKAEPQEERQQQQVQRVQLLPAQQQVQVQQVQVQAVPPRRAQQAQQADLASVGFDLPADVAAVLAALGQPAAGSAGRSEPIAMEVDVPLPALPELSPVKFEGALPEPAPLLGMPSPPMASLPELSPGLLPSMPAHSVAGRTADLQGMPVAPGQAVPSQQPWLQPAPPAGAPAGSTLQAGMHMLSSDEQQQGRAAPDLSMAWPQPQPQLQPAAAWQTAQAAQQMAQRQAAPGMPAPGPAASSAMPAVAEQGRPQAPPTDFDSLVADLFAGGMPPGGAPWLADLLMPPPAAPGNLPPPASLAPGLPQQQQRMPELPGGAGQAAFLPAGMADMQEAALREMHLQRLAAAQPPPQQPPAPSLQQALAMIEQQSAARQQPQFALPPLAPPAQTAQSFQAGGPSAAVRVSIKAFGVTPSELPPTMRQDLQALLDAPHLQGFLRPGCVHVTLEAVLQDEERLAALRRLGAAGAVQALLADGASGLGSLLRAGPVLVQLEDEVAVVAGGRLGRVLQLSDCQGVLPAIRSISPPVLHTGGNTRLVVRGTNVAAPQARLLVRSEGRYPLVEILGTSGSAPRPAPPALSATSAFATSSASGEAHSGCSSAGSSSAGSAATPAPAVAGEEWVELRLPELQQGLYHIEVQRGALLSHASSPLLALDSPAAVAELTSLLAAQAAAGSTAAERFVHSIGLVLRHRAQQAQQAENGTAHGAACSASAGKELAAGADSPNGGLVDGPLAESEGAASLAALACQAARQGVVAAVARCWPALAELLLPSVTADGSSPAQAVAAMDAACPGGSSLLMLATSNGSAPLLQALGTWGRRAGFTWPVGAPSGPAALTPLHLAAAAGNSPLLQALYDLDPARARHAWHTAAADDGLTPAAFALLMANRHAPPRQPAAASAAAAVPAADGRPAAPAARCGHVTAASVLQAACPAGPVAELPGDGSADGPSSPVSGGRASRNSVVNGSGRDSRDSTPGGSRRASSDSNSGGHALVAHRRVKDGPAAAALALSPAAVKELLRGHVMPHAEDGLCSCQCHQPRSVLLAPALSSATTVSNASEEGECFPSAAGAVALAPACPASPSAPPSPVRAPPSPLSGDGISTPPPLPPRAGVSSPSGGSHSSSRCSLASPGTPKVQPLLRHSSDSSPRLADLVASQADSTAADEEEGSVAGASDTPTAAARLQGGSSAAAAEPRTLCSGSRRGLGLARAMRLFGECLAVLRF